MESTFLMPKGRGRPRRSCEDSSATRAVRFSFEENCVLITKVCEYYQEIVGSATAKTPQRKKNELWRKIVDAVNAVGGNGRTELVVKKRYFDVKRQLKKKLCKAASHATDIGGEKSEEADLTSYEEELLRVLIPGTGVDFEGIVDTERSTTTERSRRKSNEARQKILDAFKTVRTDHSDRAVKRKYFDAKRQLRKNLYRTPFYGRRTGSSHLSHEGVHSEALIDTLALQTVMHIKGSVDTDLPLVSQGSRSPVRLNKEESMTSEQMQGSVKSIDCQRYVFQTSPCLEANEMEVSDEPSDSLQTDCPRYVFKSSPCSETHQMEGNDEPSASLQAGSPRYVFKTSPCAETHQLEVSDEPSGPLQTAVLSGDQEEIISIIVGSEEVPSTSASICPQSSAVSSSSSPLPGSLDASVTVFVHKTTEQLNKISDVMSTQSHTDESHHTEILEVLHDIRNDLAELRQQTQISNELQNQKRLDNKLFRDQLLQLKREKLDILRMKYGLGSPSSSKPLHEQQEESSSNEDEFSCSEIKKIHKDKERFILIL